MQPNSKLRPPASPVRLESRNIAATRKLGIYLLVLVGLELLSVLAPTLGGNVLGPAAFLTPRVGRSVVVATMFREELAVGRLTVAPLWLLTEGVSAAWLTVLAILFVRRRRPLKTYIASEIILSLPTLAFGLYVIIHDDVEFMERNFAALLVILWAIFSLVPVLMAVKALKWDRSRAI